MSHCEKDMQPYLDVPEPLQSEHGPRNKGYLEPSKKKRHKQSEILSGSLPSHFAPTFDHANLLCYTQGVGLLSMIGGWFRPWKRKSKMPALFMDMGNEHDKPICTYG